MLHLLTIADVLTRSVKTVNGAATGMGDTANTFEAHLIAAS